MRTGKEIELRVLVVEDSADDVQLLLRELLRGGYRPSHERVDSPEALRSMLDRQRWDIIFADYTMPRFSGTEALAIVRKHGLDTPFIFVSGTIGEDTAVEAMQAGAQDYLSKSNLKRLLPAVRRELRDAELRREYVHGEAERRATEARFRSILDVAADAIVVVDDELRVTVFNQGAEQTFGYRAQEVIGSSLDMLLPERFHADHRTHVHAFAREPVAARRMGQRREVYGIRKDGTEFPAEASISKLIENGKTSYTAILRDISERKRIEQELRQSEAGLRRAQHLTKLGHVITAPDGTFVSWSETLEQVLGVDSAHMPTTSRAWLALVHPDDREMFRTRAIACAKRSERANSEYRLRHADGTWIELRQELEPLGGPDSTGRRRWFNTIQDVTEQKEQQRRIARLNRIYAVLSGINSAIVRIHDRQELLEEVCAIAVNAGAFKLALVRTVDPVTRDLTFVATFGATPEYMERLKKVVIDQLPPSARLGNVAVRDIKASVSNDIATDPALAPVSAILLEAGVRSCAVFPLIVEGQTTAVLALLAGEIGFFDDEEVKLLSELASDISFGLEYIEKEKKLTYLAYYDALTGLANSALFDDRLTQFLQSAKRDQGTVAVILIDIDHFTHLNDTFGRSVGDALLREVAQRFAAALWEPFSLARISADTYAVAVPDLRSGVDAASIANKKLFESLGRPTTAGGVEIRLSAHAGIALYPVDGNDAATLFKNAEAALKQAKSSGERCLYYTPEINATVAEQLALENRLRIATDRKQFVLHYQPKIDSRQGRVVGLEALIRWNDPDAGLVAPGLFIPMLETSGLILEVGEWALQQALTDFQIWREQGLHPPRIAVNVSPVQFRRQDLADIVKAAVERSGAGADALELEITEGVIMENVEVNTRTLQRIRSMGVTIAIDDFGTGYSSLGYLAKLPVDTLKIDRSFIITMVSEPGSLAIVSTVISMAHSLEKSVVAEGVDAEEQAKLLQRLNCDELQGYLFSKPVPADEIARILRERRVLAPNLVSRVPAAQTLLVLDTDREFLTVLEHRLQREDYRVLLTSSVSDAFVMLARHEVGAVLCDQHLPGADGVEFLRKVRSMYPQTVRLLCSSDADFEIAQAAINVGAVHKFVVKSEDTAELRALLGAVFQSHRRGAFG